MKMQEKSKVIIICSTNNYNELGLVRSFGVNNIKPYGIIICGKKSRRKDWLRHSRYWKKIFFVESADDGIELLKEKFSDEVVRPVVITPIDYVVHMLDSQYDILSRNFILQNVNERPNGINDYANKLKQAELTVELGFKTLPTKIISLESYSSNIVSAEEYPILLKPVAGGEGHKDDITICNNVHELDECIALLQTKGYNRVLCQKYLANRQEFVIYGALSRTKNLKSYTILTNIRQWPLSYGVGSYALIVNDERWNAIVDELFQKLIDFGYDGPIDVEMFLDTDNNEIYVSEYNWRPGGRNFTSLGTGVYSIVLWYLVRTNQSIDGLNKINQKDGYSMNDGTDYNHVINGFLNYKEWKKDFKRSCARALWMKQDPFPAFIPYMFNLKRRILKK